MPLTPKHKPGSDRPVAERQFVDREEFIAPVHAALREPQRTEPLVLVYYGGAGIGKSRLRKELVRQLAGEPGVVTATLDFDTPSYRQPETALFTLRKTISEAYQVKFPSFDLAYAVYWQKTHPETPLTYGDTIRNRGDSGHVPEEALPLLEPGSLLSQVLDDTGKIPLIGLIPKIAATVKSVDRRQETGDRDSPACCLPPTAYWQDWWQQRGERELEDLPQMEPGAIVERLPMFWAADLKDHLAKKGNRAVLFIDAYEGLWEIGQTEADFFKRDEWVRELVMQLPEVLWVICGRQKLRWEEVEKDWGKVLSQHQLEPLPDPAARRFLTSCGITNEPIQDAIVKGSQGVPHYLDLAVDTAQSAKFEVRSSKYQEEVDSAGTPKEMVAQFLRHLDQSEIETLQVLSGPRFWYYGLFENLIGEYQTGYPLTAYDDLSRFSFVSEGAAPGTRTMHELMREALQENQSPELRKRVHLFLHDLYAKQLEGLDVKNITENHRAALTEAFYHGRQAKSAEELWSWLKVAHDVFTQAGQYRLLTPLYREIVQALETEYGPNHLSVAESLFRLATVFTSQGEYGEAEPLFRRALAIFEGELGPEHELVCDCLVWLARTLRERARYDEAEVLCRRAVGVFDKPGKATLCRWEALGNLAVVLIREQKYAEAEEFARRALAISEKELGPDHRYTANDLNTLAGLFLKQGRYTDAVPLFRRALAIYEKNLGANHPRVALLLDNLGMAFHFLCRYTEAESLSRRALRLSEETLGPDSPRTAVSLNNLGTLLREQGRYAEAEPLLRRALAVHEKKMGPDHYRTVGLAGNLVSVLARQGKYAEAEPMILSAIATCEKKLGPDHLATASALYWAGDLYGDKGQYANAESYLRRALDIQSRVLGQEHWLTLRSLDALALLEERQGTYAEAESSYRNVLEKRERVLGPDHPDVASTADRLAGICCRDGHYTEAEALYRRALAIREKVFGPNHPFTAETLEGLAKVCEQTGRTAEAQELSARAKTIRAQSAQA